MSELKPCPFCGGESVVVKTAKCGRYIVCWDCGCRTEDFETDYAGTARDKAVAAWNRRAQPANEPLTNTGGSFNGTGNVYNATGPCSDAFDGTSGR